VDETRREYRKELRKTAPKGLKGPTEIPGKRKGATEIPGESEELDSNYQKM
jgi:hypothetical protein